MASARACVCFGVGNVVTCVLLRGVVRVCIFHLVVRWLRVGVGRVNGVWIRLMLVSYARAFVVRCLTCAHVSVCECLFRVGLNCAFPFFQLLVHSVPFL